MFHAFILPSPRKLSYVSWRKYSFYSIWSIIPSEVKLLGVLISKNLNSEFKRQIEDQYFSITWHFIALLRGTGWYWYWYWYNWLPVSKCDWHRQSMCVRMIDKLGHIERELDEITSSNLLYLFIKFYSLNFIHFH